MKLSLRLNQITNNIKNWLRDKGISLSPSSIYGQLIQVITSLHYNVMAYLEDALTEQNKYTAQRKKSIFALASQSGYEPHQGSASSCLVEILVKNNNVNEGIINIPNYSRMLCRNNGLYYTLLLNNQSTYGIDLALDHRHHTLELIQGKYESQTFSYRERPTFTINLSHVGYLDTSKMVVSIDEEILLPYTSESRKGYLVRYAPVGGLDVIIINDFYSIETEEYSQEKTVKIEYICHDGERGNFDFQSDLNDIEFIFVDSLYRNDGEEFDGNELFTINTTSYIPGTNPDTTEKVRYMIGLNSRTEVLTSPDHFKEYLSRFSLVGYSKTWSEPNSMQVVSRILKDFTVKLDKEDPSSYLKLTENDFILSDFEKQTIKNSIIHSNRLLAGTTFDIIDMELHKYAIYVYANILHHNSTILSSIKDIILKFFIQTEIDGFIAKSDIIEAIEKGLSPEQKKDLQSLNIYFLSENNEKAKIESYYLYKKYIYHPIKGYSYIKTEKIWVAPNADPGLGLDEHGNIDTSEFPNQIPVLMGGWSWRNNDNQLISIPKNNPIFIYPNFV